MLGSNGAGKSTFFLNINGVLKSHHGDIYYRGEKITKKNLNDLRKNVGIVFQDADNQIIASTVMAEVSFGPMNLKLPKKEVISRVDKALEYMNISEFKDRPPHYLMRQCLRKFFRKWVMKDGQCSFLLTMLILLIAGQRELLYFVMERLLQMIRHLLYLSKRTF